MVPEEVKLPTLLWLLVGAFQKTRERLPGEKVRERPSSGQRANTRPRDQMRTEDSPIRPALSDLADKQTSQQCQLVAESVSQI